MVGTYHGNKSDKLEKTIRPQFPTKVLQIWLGQDKRHNTKKSSLEQSSSLHNQIHDIINPKYLKKEREENLRFSQEWFKDKSNETHSPANPSEGVGQAF